MKYLMALGFVAITLLLTVITWNFWGANRMDPFSQESLFVKDGKVTDPVAKLMGLTGIRISGDSLKPEEGWPEARIYLQSRDLKEVVSAIQGKLDSAINWLGNPQKERWEQDLTKPVLSESQARDIIHIALETLGQGNKTVPQASPKAVLFLGATLSRVRLRLAFLNDLYETQKLSPSLPVYILTGERPLDEKTGETSGMLNNPHNGMISFRQDWQPSLATISDEGEMIKLVFSQSHHPAFEEKNLFLVYAFKGTGKRATTASTVQQWLTEFSPQAGKYVAISNQPYNFYQECVIRRTLLQSGRPDIQVEVVGPGTKDEEGTAVQQAQNLLNNTSRILYELLLIQEAGKTAKT